MMKKLALVLCIALLSTALFSCSDTEKKTNKTAEPEKETTTKSETDTTETETVSPETIDLDKALAGVDTKTIATTDLEINSPDAVRSLKEMLDAHTQPFAFRFSDRSDLAILLTPKTAQNGQIDWSIDEAWCYNHHLSDVNIPFFAGFMQLEQSDDMLAIGFSSAWGDENHYACFTSTDAVLIPANVTAHEVQCDCSLYVENKTMYYSLKNRYFFPFQDSENILNRSISEDDFYMETGTFSLTNANAVYQPQTVLTVSSDQQLQRAYQTRIEDDPSFAAKFPTLESLLTYNKTRSPAEGGRE